MHDIVSVEKSKGLKWEAPRCVAYYLPDVRVASTKDRQNWVHAMMLDPRLNRGMYTRAVLTRLIGHLHLKTGKCNPMLGTLALDSRETGERAVRLVLEKAEKLGWIKRIYRHGGGGRHRNAANQYEFTRQPCGRSRIYEPSRRSSAMPTGQSSGPSSQKWPLTFS